MGLRYISSITTVEPLDHKGIGRRPQMQDKGSRTTKDVKIYLNDFDQVHIYGSRLRLANDLPYSRD